VTDFWELEERIDALCRRVASAPRDDALLTEMEDLLAEGYLRALQSDQQRRRLQSRRDLLTATTEEMQAAARQELALREATGQLRLRLAVMHAHWEAARASAPA
jgi:hypothetical protein